MPVQFHPSEIDIRHFRGISELRITLTPGEPLYVIGPNNSGKSTILNAAALALRGGPFYRFDVGEFDFYHHPDGKVEERFTTSVSFVAPLVEMLPAVQGVGDPQPVHGMAVNGKYDRGRRPSHRRVLLDADGKAITFSQRTTLKKDAKKRFKDHKLGWGVVYARPDDLREHLPEVWLLRPDNLYRSLYDWKTGPLQRLAAFLTERFLEEEWELEWKGKPRPMPDAVYKAHEFTIGAIAEFPFWKDDLKPRLDDALSRYLGRQGRFDLNTSIKTVDEWVTQQLVASLASDAGGATTPLAAMGDGWQSLVRVAALEVVRAYPQISKERVVLLLEEPEAYLHPHLSRKLRNVLADLARAGWTVIATTHSPEFISFRQPQTVARLWREGGSVTHGLVQSAGIPDSARFQEKLDERGNHEMLFANRVVLCEGKDDVFAVTGYLEKVALDIDGRSITVLDVGGVENLPAYARMASDLGVPWCGLTDEDILADGTVNPMTERVRSTLHGLKGTRDEVPMWTKSLESSVGLTGTTKASPRWQEENIVPLTLQEIQTRFPAYVTTCEAIHQWAAS